MSCKWVGGWGSDNNAGGKSGRQTSGDSCPSAQPEIDVRISCEQVQQLVLETCRSRRHRTPAALATLNGFSDERGRGVQENL